MPLLTLLGQAAVGTDVSVNAGSLVITTFPATVSLDRDIAVNAGSLVLTPNAATVSLDRDISANAGSLVITPQPATISKATTISVNAGSLVLTPFAATIQAGGAVLPTFTGTIPDITLSVGDADLATDLTSYFTGATSYTIDPTVETGWSFTAGTLTVDSDYGFFGPYVVTGTNAIGDTKSNNFSVEVTFTADVTPSGGGQGGLITKQRGLSVSDTNRKLSIKKTNRKLN